MDAQRISLHKRAAARSALKMAARSDANKGTTLKRRMDEKAVATTSFASHLADGVALGAPARGKGAGSGEEDMEHVLVRAEGAGSDAPVAR